MKENLLVSVIACHEIGKEQYHKGFVALKRGQIASTFGYSGRPIFKANSLMFCPMNVASLLRRITWFVSGIDQIGVTFVVLKFVASILATRESIREH